MNTFRTMDVNEGDVFQMEINNGYKLYFQYIGNDSSCDDAPLIRVFSTKYDIDNMPDIDSIV